MVAREFRGITTGVPLAPSAWKLLAVNGLGVTRLLLVLRGCAQVLACNHAEQPFGGGPRDTARAIIPFGAGAANV